MCGKAEGSERGRTCNMSRVFVRRSIIPLVVLGPSFIIYLLIICE